MLNTPFTSLLNNRAIDTPASHVALETTLLLHGVPRDRSVSLAASLDEIIRAERVRPAIVGVVRGVPTVGVTRAELADLLDEPKIPKANTSNLGLLIHRGSSAATTVSTTMELASLAGLRVFATGGIGGVHRDYGRKLDISADLVALARFPVAVVTSGVKSLLDVVSTREALETLGVPVVGFRTDAFPAFYLRESDANVDARFDDVRALARFVRFELDRTGRGVVVANPIPEADAIEPALFDAWLQEAESRVASSINSGRDVTPALLAALHDLSGGATLKANIALVEANAALAGALCREMLLVEPGARLPDEQDG
ncbi:MAG: pseudouridine-5'-phosphate glycosidase [Phycisphaerales bacterium]|nr:pseudouridine-5'-phosphate glycosidase [Phycisphaerales bacterium]